MRPNNVRSDLEELGRVIGVDENLRIRLGLPSIEPGVELYGACVEIRSAPHGAVPRQGLKPRCLVLSLNRTTNIDAEKDVCAINRSIMDLLGGEPGDKLSISAFSKDGKRRTIVRRAMCGSTGRWDYWPKDYKYPGLGEVHLDAEDRELLGLGAETQREYRERIEGHPLLVSIDIFHQIKKRIILYAFSLLSSIVGAILVGFKVGETLLGEEAVKSAAPNIFVWSTLASLAFVLLLIHLDISSRVNP